MDDEILHFYLFKEDNNTINNDENDNISNLNKYLKEIFSREIFIARKLNCIVLKKVID